MFIAPHTMPGPSAASINVALLLRVLSPIVLVCLLTAFLAPSASTVRRALASLVGTALGTVMLTLATWLAIIAAVAVARTVDDVVNSAVVATGVVLLAVQGAVFLAFSVRATRTVCLNWSGDLSATDVLGSHDQLLAASWAAGLLVGLIVAIATNTSLPIAVGAMGGTLIAAGVIVHNRRQHQGQSAASRRNDQVFTTRERHR